MMSPSFTFHNVVNYFLRFMRVITPLIVVFSAQPVLAAEDSPCRVDLIFASKDGGSLANYVLTLQVKNTTGRNINGVSVLYKDMSEAIIGNTFLQCGSETQAIKPGGYGECARTIQSVDASYINSFGVEKWTETVNDQLQKLNQISFCEVLGFSY